MYIFNIEISVTFYKYNHVYAVIQVDTAGWLKRTKQEKGEHPSALCNQGRVYSRLI